MNYPGKEVAGETQEPIQPEETDTEQVDPKVLKYEEEIWTKLAQALPSLSREQTQNLTPIAEELAKQLSEKDHKIIDQQEEISRLEEASDHDPKFPNFLTLKAFQTRFNEYLQECRRNLAVGQDYPPTSVAFLDLDLFHDTNEILGHTKADEVLELVSELIRSEIRPDDDLARYGGEEIAILFRHANQEGAVIAVDRIRKLIPDAVSALLPEGANLIQTISGGIVQMPSDLTADQLSDSDFGDKLCRELIDKADKSHYDGAKKAGRNKIGVMLLDGIIRTAFVQPDPMDPKKSIVVYKNPNPQDASVK